MSKKLNRAAVVRRKRKEIQQQIFNLEDDLFLAIEGLNPDDHPVSVTIEPDPKKEKSIKNKIRSLKLKLKNLGGKGGGGMYSPSKPLKDQSLLSMAKKRQM